MKRLIIFFSLIAIAWIGFHLQSPHPGKPGVIDKAILLGLGVTFSLAALVMIRGTSRWSIRSLSLLAVVIGDAILYGSAGIRTIYHYPPQEWISDLIRAFFVVGGPLLALSLVGWIRGRENGRGKEITP